MAAVSDP